MRSAAGDRQPEDGPEWWAWTGLAPPLGFGQQLLLPQLGEQMHQAGGPMGHAFHADVS